MIRKIKKEITKNEVLPKVSLITSVLENSFIEFEFSGTLGS